MQEFICEKNNERIDKYLSEVLEKSRSTIAKMLETECILVNDKPVKTSYKIKENDKIAIVKEYVEDIPLTPEKMPLDIVYESENVIVVNKPSGLVVHPGSGNKEHTLVNGLLYHTNLSEGEENRPGIVHRIDKDTSGLMLVAKNNEAHQVLADDFKNKRVERKYIALVKGILQNNNIVIDAPIGRDEKNRKKMCVTDKNSKHAVTRVKVLKRYDKYTLIECVLETGRTHQIRVHMSSINHPILGDELYNNNKCPFKLQGQTLHAKTIGFIHPTTKEYVEFEAPIPEYMEHLLKIL